jgi:3-oxoacyl-[acyl-carrier-protein] synthase II
VSDVRVVVTGIGIVSPLGLTVASTWDSLLKGRSGIARIAAFDPTEFETQIAAEVSDFDPENYMDRKEARRADRFSQLALAAAAEAITQAGLDQEEPLGNRTSSLIASGVGGIITLSEQFDVLHDKGPKRISPFLIPAMLIDMAAANVSMKYGARGPSFATVSACASGADAIGSGYELIKRGDIDVALCGGTEAPVCPIALAGFNSVGALSKNNDDPEGASRPFDAKRDGFIIGEGASVLVIENLEHALARGATPLVELVGYGASSDASHITQPAPLGEGGGRAMQQAIDNANLKPSDVDYINAHGTSTAMNDKFETDAIKGVFGEGARAVAISSTKSMTGHLLGAAGAIESAICAMSIMNGIVPPTTNYANPDPECDLDYTPNEAREMTVDVAMTNSLGFGGHNASLVFQRYQA